MGYNNLTYATISIDDLQKIDFSQVGETSADTIRKSLDLTQFIIKWETEPSFIENDIVIPIGEYNHQQTLALMATPEWSEPFID